MTTPVWKDSKQFLLNARFTMQKQAEEIALLRAKVRRLENRVLELQSAVDRARAHLSLGYVAVATNILASYDSQPVYTPRGEED
jgi:hypothetical protein